MIIWGNSKIKAETAIPTTDEKPIWGEKEWVWPWDRLGAEWETYSLLATSPPSTESWPKTVGEICTELHKIPQQDSVESHPLFRIIASECKDKSVSHIASLTVNLGVYPIERRYPLSQSFENFSPGWDSKLIDPEMAHRWTELPPAINTEFRYPVSPHSFVYFRLGLRRDMAGWSQDPTGSNLPTGANEVDLNEPSLGYFHAGNSFMDFTIGRFPIHWSSSPDFGLALSHAVPFHNGAEFVLKMPQVRYRFLVSSLNPWLTGTPLGDTSSENYPGGSEEYLQRHYASDKGAINFHNRIYTDRIKTLFAHRLEGNIGRLEMGITETQIIGGKVPDFRDAGSFSFFHNDFKEGYTNGALSLDGRVRLPMGFSLAAEIYLDDVQYKATEGDGNTPSLLGYLGSIRHAYSTPKWFIVQSVYWIRTDPFVYGYLQPLNTMSSRHILATNYQSPNTSPFFDRIVVDYPMGYLRGGDALDFWYRMEGWSGERFKLSVSAGLLAKGVVNLHTSYQDYYQSTHDSPTGVVEREVRLRGEAEYRWDNGLAFYGGLGWQDFRNEGNVSGKTSNRTQGSVGTSWSFPHE